MKKIKLTLFIALLGVLLASCKRDITEPVISSNPAKPAISDLTLNVAFTMANADSLVKFSWAAVDYGFASSITYTLQISPNSDFSGSVADLIKTQKLTGTAKVSDINSAILSWNKDVPSNMTYFRAL